MITRLGGILESYKSELEECLLGEDYEEEGKL